MVRGLPSRVLVRRVVPFIVVAAVSVAVVVALVAPPGGAPDSYNFGVWYPPPTGYIPGTSPPNVYLTINYTGSGSAQYTYKVYYNSSSGDVVAAQGTVLVGHGTPFVVYTLIPVPQRGEVLASAQVYRSSSGGQTLVYAESLTL